MSAAGPVGRVRVRLGEDHHVTLRLEGEAEAVDLSDLAGPLVEIGLDGPTPVGRETDVTFGVLEAPDDLRVEDGGREVGVDEALCAIASAIVRILADVVALPPRTVPVTDLRRHLGLWLDEVVRGRRLLVTVRGRPTATLVPIAPVARTRPPAADPTAAPVGEGRAAGPSG